MNCSCVGKNLYIYLNSSESEVFVSLCPSTRASSIINLSIENESTAAASVVLMQIIIEAADICKMDELFCDPCEALIVDYKINRSENGQISSSILRVCRESDAEFEEKVNDKRKLSVKIKNKSYVYRFDSFFDAFDCISALKKCAIKLNKNTLFEYNKQYFLCAEIPVENRRIFAGITAEFGKKCTNISSEFLSERATEICGDFYKKITQFLR